MQDDITQPLSLQALRREVRAARLAAEQSKQRPVIIVAQNLAVAAGLLRELTEGNTWLPS